MAYKLTEMDCHRIIKDDYKLVYETELESLRSRLELANDFNSTLRLQGRILQLRQDMALNDKARAQLES